MSGKKRVSLSASRYRLPRSSRAAAAFLLASASLYVAAGLSPVIAQCSDYDSGLRWISGESFWYYQPGYYAQGTTDLARDGSRIVALDDQGGFMTFTEAAPGRLNHRGYLSLAGYRVDIEGDHAYVAGYLSAPNLSSYPFAIVDIADLSRPVLRASLNLPGAQCVDAAVPGPGASYAYVGTSSELTVVRVSDPVAPVGHLPGAVSDLVVSGDRAYILTPSALRVADISNPALPIYINTAFSSSTLVSIKRSGGHLFVTDRSDGLHIFDLANPDLPALVGDVGITAASSLAVDGTTALVGETSGIRYVDVSNPASPIARGSYRGLNVADGAIAGGTFYGACLFEGVQALAIGTGLTPDPIYSLPWAAGGADLQLMDDVLVLLKPTVGLRTIDVSDPAAPVQLGSLSLTNCRSMAVAGHAACVVNQSDFKVVDLTDPAAPLLVATVPGVTAHQVLASGNRAYAIEWYNPEVWIFDVSVPSAPMLVGHAALPSPPWVTSAALMGTRLFLGGTFESTAWLDEYDVSDPANIRGIDETYLFSETIADMAPASNGLVVATDKRIHTIDGNHLWSQRTLGDHVFAGPVAVGGEGRLYSVNAYGAFFMVTNDWLIHYVGSGMTPSPGGNGIAEVGGFVYVTDGSALRVFAPPCASSSAPLEDDEAGTAAAAGTLASFPNPFAHETSLRFQLARETRVDLRVFDAAGRNVRTLLRDAAMGPGSHSVTWDGREEEGRLLPAGVFFARLATVDGTSIVRIQRIR